MSKPKFKPTPRKPSPPKKMSKIKAKGSLHP